MSQTKEELLQAYKDALAKHDWYYMYSDDSFVYRKGQRTASTIQQCKINCIKTGLEKEAEEVYEEFMQRQANAKRY
jgi:hypothetical protein